MKGNHPQSNCSLRRSGFAALVAILGIFPGISYADESGISFWLPGQFGSLAAAPGTPGWSMAEVYYHTTVAAAGSVAALRFRSADFLRRSMSI